MSPFKFISKINKPIQIDIQNDDTSLSYQQSLILQQKHLSLELINQSNNHLDSKAIALLQVSGLIIALTGVLSIPSFVISSPSNQVKVGIAIAFLAFMGMVGLSTISWSPTKVASPGQLDWDEIYKKYILVDNTDSFNQILSDYLEAIEYAQLANNRKGKLISWATLLFILQVGGLMIIALLA